MGNVILALALHFSLPLASPASPAVSAPPSSPANGGETDEVLVVATLALSSIWIGAVIDTANERPVRGPVMPAIWPDSDDDLDVDATVALHRRVSLEAPAIRAIAAAHPRVGSVCIGASAGRATVFAVGDKSIAAIETTLAVPALSKGRVLPLAPPTVKVIPIVGDLRATFEPIGRQRTCVPVNHSGGVVNFDKERLSLDVPAREPHPSFSAVCGDEASIVVAAQRFADLLGQPSRDTVRALPQPSSPPSVVSTPMALKAMNALSSWTTTDAGTAVRRADSAMLMVKQGPDGKPIGAQVLLRAKTTSIRLYLQIVDGACSMSTVPSPWFEHGDAPAVTPLLSRWQRTGATWTKG